MTRKCSIIVNSCDKYEDVWAPFFYAFRDHCKNCNYDILLNTETKYFTLDGLNIIPANYGAGNAAWGARLLNAIKKADSEFILMLFDDYLLEMDMPQSSIDRCLQIMHNEDDIAVMYLCNIAEENIDDHKIDGFELVPLRKEYRVNSFPAIWRSECLKEYIGFGDDPWAWEFFRSIESFGDRRRFYCAQKNNELYRYNYRLGGAIHRGKWVQSVVEPAARKYNLSINYAIRGFEDENEKSYPHSLGWKIRFLIKGFSMIGFMALIPVYRSLKRKFCRNRHN